MEMNKTWYLINKFWVEYCRICQMYAILDYNAVRWQNMRLLESCIYLQGCFLQDTIGADKKYLKKICDTIKEFASIDKATSRYCLKRWFPSLVDEESSFFEFSQLLWIYDHELEEEEKCVFAQIMIPMLMYYHTGVKEVDEINTIKQWIKEQYQIEVLDSYENFEKLRDMILETWDKLLTKHYGNLYLERGRYIVNRELSFNIKNEGKQAIVQFLHMELEKKGR